MTTDQITMLLQILQNTPLNVLLTIAVISVYRDGRARVDDFLAWQRGELTKYMQDNRDIVRSVTDTKIPVASKWTPTDTAR